MLGHWASPSNPAQQEVEVTSDIQHDSVKPSVYSKLSILSFQKCIITTSTDFIATSGMPFNYFILPRHFSEHGLKTKQNDKNHFLFLFHRNCGYSLSAVQHCKMIYVTVHRFLAAYCIFETLITSTTVEQLKLVKMSKVSQVIMLSP